ncbi:MAG: hypothetical protein AB7J32_10920 [Pseudonocardia sp.]
MSRTVPPGSIANPAAAVRRSASARSRRMATTASAASAITGRSPANCSIT